jgi:tRNA (guanine26-N2/guanine27-N2)-dimethyltransferase
MYKIITEGSAKAYVPVEEKVSKDLPVFYNPVMKLNRDISVALLKSMKKEFQIGLPMEATGLRAVRFMTELTNAKSIDVNDISAEAYELIKKNIELNKENSKCKEIIASNKDANIFFLESKGYDYIDIDPFGSPNHFLENAIKRLAREGILAVTATDTGALCGTFKEAGIRKYWAKPIRNELMHEAGARILIRKVQLLGAHNEKALIPILTYSKDHYFRIFFMCEKGKEKADEIMKKHLYLLYCNKCMNRKISEFNNETCSCGNRFDYAGPMWMGNLQEKKIIKKVDNEFAKILSEESDTPFFYDIHAFAKKLKLKRLKKTNDILEEIRKTDKSATLTHFNEYSVKADISAEEFRRIIQ